MIPKSAFLAKIYELGYHYKQQQARSRIYRKQGSTEFISVRMKDFLTEDYVKGQLRQAGMTDKDINEFLKAAKESDKKGD